MITKVNTLEGLLRPPSDCLNLLYEDLIRKYNNFSLPYLLYGPYRDKHRLDGLILEITNSVVGSWGTLGPTERCGSNRVYNGEAFFLSKEWPAELFINTSFGILIVSRDGLKPILYIEDITLTKINSQRYNLYSEIESLMLIKTNFTFYESEMFIRYNIDQPQQSSISKRAKGILEDINEDTTE